MADCDIPEDLRYSIEDEWVRDEGERAVVGVTDYAQEQLGDIVFIELPELRTTVTKGAAFGVIESVKAVSELYAPISGEVVAINGDLEDQPEVVNEECYAAGWIIAIAVADRADLDSLLDAAAYRRHVEERAE